MFADQEGSVKQIGILYLQRKLYYVSCHKFLCLLRSSTSLMRKACLFKTHIELKSPKSNSYFAVVAVFTFVRKIGRKLDLE